MKSSTVPSNSPALAALSTDFEAQLKKYCRSETGGHLRPFAPNRNWKAATIFIVGTNPATPLRDQFESYDSYWDCLTRDTEKFQEIYTSARGPAKSKGTTVNLKVLLNLLGREDCLVTNACWYPTKRRQAIPREERTRHHDALRLLIQFCRPKAILFHGNPAIGFAESVYGLNLDRRQPVFLQDVVYGGTLFLAYPHLSGMGLENGEKVSFREDVVDIAARIRGHVSTQ
ncbi:hypothetical protein P0D69_43215 [Paraburkholderia sediminicola]|uniref:hypothetical protein n=1 Tax=Paraburkholderia sediminicola TaxID=458836 RepID=UPI0038BCB208